MTARTAFRSYGTEGGEVASAPECVYYERDRRCHETAIVTIRIGGRETPLCDRHSRPEFHPPDLHKKLPGRLKRAIASR